MSEEILLNLNSIEEFSSFRGLFLEAVKETNNAITDETIQVIKKKLDGKNICYQSKLVEN